MRKPGFESLSRSSIRPVVERQWFMSSDRSTGSQVARLLDAGLSRAEVAARLGISRSTVSYHARRLGRPGFPACARRYDWARGQAYYDAGHSISEYRLISASLGGPGRAPRDAERWSPGRRRSRSRTSFSRAPAAVAGT